MGQQYTEHQHDAAFRAWYAAGRPTVTSFARQYRDLVTTKPLSTYALLKWAHDDHWQIRADAMDAPVLAGLDQSLMQDRRRMLETHRNIARLLQSKGVAYLRGHEISTEYGAVAAVKTGVEMEQEITGNPELAFFFSLMSEDELRVLMGRADARLSEARDGVDEFDADETERPQLFNPAAKRLVGAGAGDNGR